MTQLWDPYLPVTLTPYPTTTGCFAILWCMVLFYGSKLSKNKKGFEPLRQRVNEYTRLLKENNFKPSQPKKPKKGFSWNYLIKFI